MRKIVTSNDRLFIIPRTFFYLPSLNWKLKMCMIFCCIIFSMWMPKMFRIIQWRNWYFSVWVGFGLDNEKRPADSSELIMSWFFSVYVLGRVYFVLFSLSFLRLASSIKYSYRFAAKPQFTWFHRVITFSVQWNLLLISKVQCMST